VQKKKVPTRSPGQGLLLRWPQALWGLWGLAVWSFQQVLHSQRGEPFSALLYLKGILLIAGVAYLFHRWQTKGFLFLGMFPFLWLGLSRAQWEICSPAGGPYWNWLVLFLLSEVLLLNLSDGRKLFFLLAPLWAIETHLFRFSLLLPLAFLRFPEGSFPPWTRFKTWLTRQEHMMIGHWGKGPRAILLWLGWVMTWNLLLFGGATLAWYFPVILIPLALMLSPSEPVRGRAWMGWGGAVIFLGLFLVYRGWKEYDFDLAGSWVFLIEQRYLAFFLLGWLGLISLPKKGNLRSSVFVLFPLVLGLLFWPGPSTVLGVHTLLLWVMVLFAGLGWESFRVNLMDQSWHGRLVWIVLGLCLLIGLL
jgi:hypothetical protein